MQVSFWALYNLSVQLTRGQQCLYTPELAEIVLNGLKSGKGLRQICQHPDLPDYSTVCDWAINDIDGFAQRYAHARLVWLDLMAEECVSIAETPELGQKTIARGDGRTDVITEDMTEHRKLRIDTRKWILSKLRPDKYGDRSLSGPQEVVVTVRPSWIDAPAQAVDAKPAKRLPPGGSV